MKKLIYILSLLIISFSVKSFAQPFVYHKGSLVDSSAYDADYWLYSISKLNLDAGNEELFLFNASFPYLLTWDPTQTWLIVDYPGYMSSKIYNTTDTLISITLPDGIAGLNENFLFYEADNYIYILGYNGVSETINALNLSSGQIENSDIINRGDHNYYEEMFFSSAKDKIYLSGYDSISNKDQVIIYSIQTKEVTEKKDLALYGYPNADYYFLYAGKNGKGIVESYFMNDTTSYYRIYDFDLGSGSNFIEHKGFAVPFFIENENGISLAETDIDGQSIIYSGKIFFYNMETSGLVKTLSLSPGGNIFTFENFPDILYYVNGLDTSPQIFRIDADSILSEDQDTGLNINLTNSEGALLAGGSLQYYEGSWKDAVNNGDGTFKVTTELANVSLRMTYAHGSQTVSNVPAQNNTYTFQTVNAQVKLEDSNGNPIDTGKVQYYAGAWREFGTTASGIAAKELLPNNYSFRMSYGFASNDKQQNISADPVVAFQTVNAQVELRNSAGSLIDQGTVQYYAGAWRAFGTTANGVAAKELLPNNYSFRMSFGFASNDKQQNIGTDSVVVFQTVNAQVELRNSAGSLIDQGTVQYYTGAWREFGTTSNGVAAKELLPNNYSFRMSYGFASNDKQQNISANPVVVFQTVNTQIELRNSAGSLIDQGTVQYYGGAWREFGTTSNGIVTKELLPNNYSFRMSNNFISNDKQQNIASDPVVVFSTLLCTVNVSNSQGQPIDNAIIRYYAGAWRDFGTTVNGTAAKDLLPANLSFRAISGGQQQDKTQNISTNSTVDFILP